MPRSLADLRADKAARKPQSLPERAIPLCLAPHLVAEVMSLSMQLDAMPAPTLDDNGERKGPPARIGLRPEDAGAREIRDRIRVLLDEMAEYDGVLRVRAIDDGEWRRWVDEHPPRPEGQPGHDRDVEVAGGYCNADDLIDSLATYAHSWNGEELADGDWEELLAGNISGADKKDVATAVVTMHESRLDFQQWRSGLSASLTRSNDEPSPGPSGSRRGGSSAGSQSSDTSTTTPTGS